MKSWMQFSRFLRYENCVVQKMMVRCASGTRGARRGRAVGGDSSSDVERGG